MNKSPLRYPGGKTKACAKLKTIVNKYFDMSNYIELISPFFGGGSFEFCLQSEYKLKLTVNDKFRPLYNFWNKAKTDNINLCKQIFIFFENGVTKENFSDLREMIIDDDDFNQAVHYFIINRCSFSGATLSGGFSLESSKKRFTKSSIDRVSKLNLSNVEISNMDFEDFIEVNKHKKDALMFLDPPYYLEKTSSNKLYGNNGDLHENFDHKKLFDIVSKKTDWIMTYNNCEYIRNMYKDFIILDVDWKYGMNKSKESSEIVIISKTI